MKKIIFMVLCSLVFFSCEQEEIWSDNHVENENSENLSLRSAGDVTDPIKQLSGIPVYIKSVYSKKYLSVVSNDGGVGLASQDDGSLRQRWNIIWSPNLFTSFKVTPLSKVGNFSRPMLVIGYYRKKYVPYVSETIIDAGNFGFGQNTDICSYYFNTMPEGGYPPMGTPINPINVKSYIQPVSMSSNEIKVDNNYYKDEQTKWEIIPVDEFRVEDITYDLMTSDKLNVIPTEVAVKILANDTDIPATRTISFLESITNESSFSETEGLKVNISTSTSAKVGIGKFVEGSFSVGTSVDKSWSYTVGSRETKTYTISESITQEIPPRTTIKAQLVATKYDANLTYIAKLYGINTGKTIYLKGKWNGVVIQESKIVLTQQNQVLKTIKVSPTLQDNN